MKGKKKNRYIWMVLAAFLMAYFVSGNLFQLILIQGDSMEPAYHNMQLALLDKRDKTFGSGDVIAFRCNGLDAVLVKRIVACAGDTVLIKGGRLYVNDEIDAAYQEVGFAYAGIAEREVHLEKNEYFVIGDNVSESKDSRYEAVGIVQASDIIAKIYERDC